MSKTTLLIAAGTPVFYLGEGLNGSLVNDAVVDFGEASFDDLAQAWANDQTISREQRLVFLELLTHTDPETGRPVKYTPQGTPVLLNEDQEEFFRVREAIERGVEKANAIASFASEAEEDKFSDTIAEEVARSSDSITSPSEAAEASEANAPKSNEEDIPPGPANPIDPQPNQDSHPVDPIVTGTDTPSGSPSDSGGSDR